jgi:type II secretory ATPase GspE/PulE/Tfp pilus assembly ATPase PilB-like protein
MRDEGKGSVYLLLSHEEKLKRCVLEDSIISVVDSLLFNAIGLHASDIHLQPHENDVVVRYRIDGMLYDQTTLDHAQAALALSRLKILANLDIAQRRIPQDGRFKASLASSTTLSSSSDSIIDFRVSTFPTLHGEKMVLRILDRSLRLLSLDSLGLSSTMYDLLQQLIKRPHGLFLVTGPTGCGKTTMLYALISALNTSEKNIVTIEDPIEYELQGITQSQINEKAGFTFENGLRAMLRQDPDIIMIGEVRDKSTASIAIESSLTGHLVLSTLHTNDASSAVVRLIEMGVEPFLVSATLVGVLAQRLVRRLCDHCKKEKPLDDAFKPLVEHYNFDATSVYGPVGCGKCHGIGYRGRVGIFETLMINDPLRSLIVDKADAATLRKVAMEQGLVTLMQDGLEKVKEGITSLDELLGMTVDEVSI